MTRKLLLAATALALLACGGGEEPADTSTTAPNVEAAPTTEPAPETTMAPTTATMAPTTTTMAPTTTEAPASGPTQDYGYDTPGADSDSDTDAADQVEVTESDLGEILVDGEGYTLYLFVPDAQSESTCYDDCAANWPALPAEVSAGEGLDESLLGSTPRDDGSEQATYNGWPLYYFAGDVAAGDINGQGVGDVWYAVTPTGDAVEG